MTELGIALFILLSLPPITLGYLAGLIVEIVYRVSLFCWANLRIGYYKGRGYELVDGSYRRVQ